MQLRFKNADLQKQIEHEGYVQFPLLSKGKVDELLDGYAAGVIDEKSGFHCTMFNSDNEYRKSVNRSIKEVFDEALLGVVVGADMLYANFMVKEPDEGSDFYVHQDWTYVDENKASSWAIWVPLVDLTDSNGALHVVPGSHRMENNFRGPGVADALEGLHDVIRNEFGVPLYLKAGEAVVWNHKLVHYSPPNRSTESRVAATVVLVPKGEQVVHCRAGKSDLDVDIHEVVEDFYMNYEIEKGPEGSPVRRVSFDRILYSEKEFKQLINGGNQPSGLLSKVMSFFN